jgi:ethanolamine utilization microcompartment shell protein EutS
MVFCCYCEKQFSTNSSLNLHKRTARYCLRLQNKSIDKIQYKCSMCCSEFSTKANLDRHESESCPMLSEMGVNFEKTKRESKEELDETKKFYDETINNLKLKYEMEIEELKCENKSLREKALLEGRSAEIYEGLAKKGMEVLNRIAEQPKSTTTNNNHNMIINNSVSLEADDMRIGIIEQFTGSTLIGGARDLVKLCIPYVTDSEGDIMYQCSDTNRGVFWRKDREGRMVKDVCAIEFIDSLHKAGLKKKVSEQAAYLVDRGLPLDDVKGYADQFAEDGDKGKKFNGAFRRHFAASIISVV